MAYKKSAQKYSSMFAFIFGMILMLVIYVLFEITTNSEFRTRTAGDSDANPESGQIFYEDSTYAPIVKTSKEEEISSSSAFLGVEVIPVDSVIAEQLNITSKNGVLINSVISNSPAQQAGLRRGDVIVALNNRTVKDIDRFRQIIAELKPGDTVRIIYIRNGKKDSVYVQLVERPALQKTAQSLGSGNSDISASQGDDWGISLSPLSSILRESFNIPADINGIMILSVSPGGAADNAGLLPGDIITGVDKTAITDMDDFFNAIIGDNNNTALLDIYSQGRMRYVPIDSTNIKVADQTQTRDTTSLRQRIFSIFTGGSPFSSDEDEEDGPKGGKFADDNISLTADNVAFNRPSTVPGDTNTGSMGSSSSVTGMNRPTEVPPQSAGPNNDIVLFIGILLIIIVYLAYREYHRPPELD